MSFFWGPLLFLMSKMFLVRNYPVYFSKYLSLLSQKLKIPSLGKGSFCPTTCLYISHNCLRTASPQAIWVPNESYITGECLGALSWPFAAVCQALWPLKVQFGLFSMRFASFSGSKSPYFSNFGLFLQQKH